MFQHGWKKTAWFALRDGATLAQGFPIEPNVSLLKRKREIEREEEEQKERREEQKERERWAEQRDMLLWSTRALLIGASGSVASAGINREVAEGSGAACLSEEETRHHTDTNRDACMHTHALTHRPHSYHSHNRTNHTQYTQKPRQHLILPDIRSLQVFFLDRFSGRWKLMAS